MMPGRGVVAGAGDSSDDDDSDAPLLLKWSYVTALINRFGDAHGFESLQKARLTAPERAPAFMPGFCRCMPQASATFVDGIKYCFFRVMHRQEG